MTPSSVELHGVSHHYGTPPDLIERLARLVRRTTPRPRLQALCEVSLTIRPGEALGLVGESGCGKSTLGRIIAGILPPSRGDVRLDGAPVATSAGRKCTTRVQMVFQDPFTSLNPRRRVGDVIGEGPMAHGLVSRGGLPAYVERWLVAVGLRPEHAARYPHQFSGGQRQRIAIARALAMQPSVLVCDEPVASLDVSVQAQIVNLLLALKRDLSLTLLFISHDLGVVHHLCDRVAVMYMGRVVELGDIDALYASPLHPYTQALLASRPRLVLDGVPADSAPIRGELPSPRDVPAGCAFRTRCPRAIPACQQDIPELKALLRERSVACHNPVRSLSSLQVPSPGEDEACHVSS